MESLPHDTQGRPLPQDHLALVILDALAAADEVAIARTEPASRPDLRAAILYGWATGAVTARELAHRAQTDSGLRYLLDDAALGFEEVRRFREGHRGGLLTACARVLDICRAAGMDQLGRIHLGGATPRAGLLGPPSEGSQRIARELITGADLADAAEDQDLADPLHGGTVPPLLADQQLRQNAFRAAFDGHREGGHRESLTSRATRRIGFVVSRINIMLGRAEAPTPVFDRTRQRSRPSVIPSAFMTLAVVAAGLILVRWVVVSTASSLPQPRGVTNTSEVARATAEPDGGLDALVALLNAREEAWRLAMAALEDDDVESAHNYLVLVITALPNDQEVAIRLRQVDAVLRIEERKDGWSEALEDISELRLAMPGSRTILQAYVTALTGAGREALDEGNRRTAEEHCGEAVRWLPTRSDAQTCLAQSRGIRVITPTSTPTPRPTATVRTPTPTRTLTPVPASQVTPNPEAGPLAGRTASVPLSAGGPLAINLTSASCLTPVGGAPAVIRVEGAVQVAGVAASDYRLRLGLVEPDGAASQVAESRYPFSRFTLQHQVAARASYIVNLTADKAGFEDGSASAQVVC